LDTEKSLREADATAHDAEIAKLTLAASDKVQSLEAALKKAELAAHGLRGELAVAESSGKDYRERAVKAETRVAELEAEAARIGNAKGEGDQRIDELEKEVARLNKENASHLDSIKQTQDRLADAYSSLEEEKIRYAEAEPAIKKAPILEKEIEEWRKKLKVAVEQGVAEVEAIKQQEAEARAKQVQQLMHSQVHVVVSAPCIKLVINHAKEEKYLPPPDIVTTKVKALLEGEVLPNYLSVLSSAPDMASKLAGEKMQKFCDDVAKGINDQIQQIVMEGGASAGVIQKG